MTIPIERNHIVFAPHFYPDVREYLISRGRPDTSKYAATVNRFRAEAAASKAVLLIGEFGNPLITDDDAAAVDAFFRGMGSNRGPAGGALEVQFDSEWLEKLQTYARGEAAAVSEFDRWAIGCVRPWFSGSRNIRALAGRNITWGIFEGLSEAPGPERKQILDVFARPIPLVIAGTVEAFAFDFASRRFEMRFHPDPAKGESEIYVPRERHFPDSFRVVLPQGLVLVWDREQPSGFRTLANPSNADTLAWRWDESRSRIMIRQWDRALPSPASLKILPGVRD